jgi:hypothetical protein
MTDIERALIHYDGNNDMPYCDLVWQALKEKKERDYPRPLTIEQLKERDGKPVWVIDNRGDIPSEWNIVVAKTGQLRDKDGRFCLFVDTCMTVYDHEPKHQTK